MRTADFLPATTASDFKYLRMLGSFSVLFRQVLSVILPKENLSQLPRFPLTPRPPLPAAGRGGEENIVGTRSGCELRVEPLEDFFGDFVDGFAVYGDLVVGRLGVKGLSLPQDLGHFVGGVDAGAR